VRENPAMRRVVPIVFVSVAAAVTLTARQEPRKPEGDSPLGSYASLRPDFRDKLAGHADVVWTRLRNALSAEE